LDVEIAWKLGDIALKSAFSLKLLFDAVNMPCPFDSRKIFAGQIGVFFLIKSVLYVVSKNK
jgi:hypothetical protein